MRRVRPVRACPACRRAVRRVGADARTRPHAPRADRAAGRRGHRRRTDSRAPSWWSGAATRSSIGGPSAAAQCFRRRRPMTLDTIFDVASLTKVVATTTAVMALVEDGRIRLADRVSLYIPAFNRYGKDRITRRPPADARLRPSSGSRPRRCRLRAAPPRRFAWRVKRCRWPRPASASSTRTSASSCSATSSRSSRSRRSTAFLKARAFGPLGMHDTTFLPPESLRERIAPTEACQPLAWPCSTPGAPMLRGVVHDPTARRMGGVAGHAGLFSTGDDLATFAQMMLADGRWKGARVLSPLTVAKMMRPATPATMQPVRGLGWDIDTTLLDQPRRAAAGRVVRPHRVHRHVALDRPAHAHLRDRPVQPRASRRQGRCDAAAGSHRERRRLGRPRCRGSAGRAPDRH